MPATTADNLTTGGGEPAEAPEVSAGRPSPSGCGCASGSSDSSGRAGWPLGVGTVSGVIDDSGIVRLIGGTRPTGVERGGTRPTHALGMKSCSGIGSECGGSGPTHTFWTGWSVSGMTSDVE